MNRIFKNLFTTISGLAVGAGTGAIMSVQAGAVTKEALIAGATFGLIGAFLKDPQWAKRMMGQVQ